MRVSMTFLVRLGVATGLAAGGATYLLGGPASSAESFRVVRVLNGASLHHTYLVSGSTPTRTEALSKPDDVSTWGQDLFVGFQNGVGPQGEASKDGNRDSTIVEFNRSGRVLAQWEIAGKADGVTADPGVGVIATVNEDANSALYVIHPGKVAATRYTYSHPVASKGGTDAITIDDGQILISASAPGTTGAAAPQATYPAVYVAHLHTSSSTVTLTPLFYDESAATTATGTATTHLALTDPDSSAVVPANSPRFAGDLMLTSQGDKEQIYVSAPGTTHQKLSVLSLSQSVDDTVWPASPSVSLFSTDSTHDSVDVITGPFGASTAVAVATPCGANGAPSTCPAPKYPANFLSALNPSTGVLTKMSVNGVPYTPQGGLALMAE